MRSGFCAREPQPGEDASEVIADRGQDGVGGIAGTAFEVAAAEMTFGFHVADPGLDGGSTSQFAFDRAEDAALLSRDEDAAWILRIVAAVTLVDVGALDLAADGEQSFPVLRETTDRVVVLGGRIWRRTRRSRPRPPRGSARRKPHEGLLSC